MHAHNEYEIHFSKCGGLNFYVDNKIYPVTGRDLFVFSSTDLHRINVPENILYERYIVSFNPDVAREIGGDGVDLLECFDRRPAGVGPRLTMSDEDIALYTHMADRLYDVFNARTMYGSSFELKMILGQILIFINRLFHEKYSQSSENGEIRISSHRMNQITRYIDTNFAKEIRLSDMAEMCHLDKAYLCRLFKKTTGVCITDYINYRRISYAITQLRVGMSVSEVSRASGFNSDAYFITAFKRTMGITPKQYAKQNFMKP